MSMATRLKEARIAAGYKTALDAVKNYEYKSSTYLAHENGQNKYKINDAEKYAKAYGVCAIWLLFGVELKQNISNSKIANICSKQKCPEKITAYSILIKDDPENIQLVEGLYECVKRYKAALSQ